MITVTFHCGGCQAEAKGIAPLRNRFTSVTGRPYGIGSYRWDTPEQVVPEGWTVSDLIGADYCPVCSKALKSKEEE